jgi:modulator of FtsH protease HflC
MFTWLALAAIPVAVLVVAQTFYIVDERNQVIVTQVGQYRHSVREPGLYAKIPFYQSATHFDKRILVSDPPSGEYLTLDQKRLVADPVTRWRIVDPLAFFTSVREEGGARARLDDIVFSEMRAELANFDFDKIISTERELIMGRVSQRAAERARGFGIEVVDVRLKRADLPEQVQASVFARMQAERSRIAARYRSEGAESAARIRADADRDRTVILARAYEESQRLRGTGEAEATTIYAQSFADDPEFYAFVRSLEAYERLLGADSTLVLSTDSDLFRYLNSHRAGGTAAAAGAAGP